MDTISDMLIRIKNASMARKETCTVLLSNINLKIAQILKTEGFIEDFKKEKKPHKFGYLKLKLRYISKEPAVTEIKRISHLGRRIYQTSKSLKVPKFGILIVSTPKGIMTSKEAKKKNVGGEVICEIR